MPLIILKQKIQLEKCTEFAQNARKTVHRICKLCTQNFRFFWHRILTTLKVTVYSHCCWWPQWDDWYFQCWRCEVSFKVV